MASNTNNPVSAGQELIEKAVRRLTELCQQSVRSGLNGFVSVEVHFKDGVPTNMRKLTNASER